MSPKRSQPIEDDDDPGSPEIPDGYVRVTRSRGPAPAKRRASVWWSVGAFVLAVAVTITVILLVSKPADPRAEPDTTAKAVAEALTAHDLGAVDSYFCAKAARSPEISAFYRTYGNASVLAVEELGGDFANATLRSDDRRGVELVLQMSREDDLWCVFGPVPCQVFDTGSASALPLADVCEKRPRA